MLKSYLPIRVKNAFKTLILLTFCAKTTGNALPKKKRYVIIFPNYCRRNEINIQGLGEPALCF